MSEEIESDDQQSMETNTTTITGRLEIESNFDDGKEENEQLNPAFENILLLREKILLCKAKILELKDYMSAILVALCGAYVVLASWIDFTRAFPLFMVFLVYLAVKFYELSKEKIIERLAGIDRTKIRKISAFGGIFLMLGIYAETLYTTEYRSNVITASFGILVFMFISMMMCVSIIKIVWRPILVGLMLQFFIAAFVIKTEIGFAFVESFSLPIKALLRFADAGGIFLFSGYKGDLTNFVYGVCPVIIFFSSLISMLYSIGVMDFVINFLSFALTATCNCTQSEAVACVGNIFVGIAESPLLIRPYIDHMTYSEIFCVMTSGFSSIAGSVLGAYLKLGIDARALITSSFMSAPGSLMVAKLMFPEVTPSKLTTKKTEQDKSRKSRNLLEAAVQGAMDAFPVCFNITAMLIVFVAAIECLNDIVVFMCGLFDIHDIRLETIFGVVFRPLVLLMGVPYFEADFCARLLGEKIFFTEFMAFQSLATSKGYRDMGREKCDCDGNQKWLSELSETIMTYALCGFANIPTMGIMLGTMAGLAPKRKKVFSKILAKTCVAGTICCLIRGCIACIFVRISFLPDLQLSFSSSLPIRSTFLAAAEISA
ncbi:unnamed protein product [Oikopleura dioica]|uniref:Sodium/nucleoside cotransporter n=1 Tax=Oikopleura dioica TaxID=34765 RepID=E4XLE9_OIKDI|nr:unnamed protein product [Oikopleura dioica]